MLLQSAMIWGLPSHNIPMFSEMSVESHVVLLGIPRHGRTEQWRAAAASGQP